MGQVVPVILPPAMCESRARLTAAPTRVPVRQRAQHLGVAQHFLGWQRAAVAQVEALRARVHQALQFVGDLVRVVVKRRALGAAGTRCPRGRCGRG